MKKLSMIIATEQLCLHSVKMTSIMIIAYTVVVYIISGKGIEVFIRNKFIQVQILCGVRSYDRTGDVL